MTQLVTAIRYLTIVPVPGLAALHTGPGASAAWFPVVGLLIGAVLVGVDRAVTTLFAPLLAALLTVTTWKVMTGGLHLDGLADCLDGLAGRSPAQRLAIMRDSRIGALGAVGLVLFLMLELATVSGIDSHARWRALLVAPVVGRAMPPVLARVFRAVPSGRAAAFGAELGRGAAPVAVVVALAVAVSVLEIWGAVAFATSLIVALAVGAWMTRRLGGVSGDVHGAAIECTELTVLLTMAAVSPAR